MSDISEITPQLFVASEMASGDLSRLDALDIALIISMIGQRAPEPRLRTPARDLIWLRAYDHVLTPIPLSKLEQGVRKAVPLLEDGKRVLVFCREGKRRSVTMAAAILIALDFSAEEAMTVLRERREVANPMYFYVRHRIRKFERYWRRQPKQNHES